MSILISGPGIGLPPPQNLYPSELANAPYDTPTNSLTLNAGDTLPIPAGRWMVWPGAFSVIQWLDYTPGIWRNFVAQRGQPQVVLSDGFTRRVANLTGCPVAAVIPNGGSSYAAATATLSASAGGSTWQPIVGGSLSVSSVTAAGGGYTEAPLVFIPAPPNPGIPATAYATITSGTVSAVSLVNFGAGYTTAPTAVILPNPTDTSTTITQATVTFGLANSGKITGALCTNNGAPLTNLTGLTLTAAGGAGSGATVTAVVMQTATSISIVSGGTAFGDATHPALITSVDGVGSSVAATSLQNPLVDLAGYLFRPIWASGVCNAGGTITSINTRDSGLFVGTPTPVAAPGAAGSVGAVTWPQLAFSMGSTVDTIFLQSL